MYIKVFTKYPYLKWAFHSHNPISSLYHLLIWMPVAMVQNQRNGTIALIKYLREMMIFQRKSNVRMCILSYLQRNTGKLLFYLYCYRFQKILSSHRTIIFKRSYLLWLITYFQVIRETNYHTVSYLFSKTRCLKCIWAPMAFMLKRDYLQLLSISPDVQCILFFFTISKMVIKHLI